MLQETRGERDLEEGEAALVPALDVRRRATRRPAQRCQRVARLAAAVQTHVALLEIAPEHLIRADGVQAENFRGSGDAGLRVPLPEPFARRRPLADPALFGIEAQEPVTRPCQRIEAPEFAWSLALPAERPTVDTIQAEDLHLAVEVVSHVDLIIRPEHHAGHSSELVGRSSVGQGLRTDRDDEFKARQRRRTRVGNGDRAIVVAHEVGSRCAVLGAGSPEDGDEGECGQGWDAAHLAPPMSTSGISRL